MTENVVDLDDRRPGEPNELAVGEVAPVSAPPATGQDLVEVRDTIAWYLHVRWLARRGAVGALRMVIRVIHPKTIGRSVIAVARGVGLTIRGLTRFLTAYDLAELRSKNPGRHYEEMQTRRIIAAVVTVLAVALGVVAWWFAGVLVFYGLGAVSLVTVWALGRKGPVIVDAPQLRALGASEEIVRTAFASTDLAKAPEDIRVVAPIQRQGTAWHTVVQLPQGTPADKAVKRRNALAGAFGVGPVQLLVRPRPGNNGQVLVWCSDRDPWLAPPNINPLVSKPVATDIWNAVRIGLDARGHEVRVPLVFSGILVGGLPRMGKTVSVNNVIAPALLDTSVRLWLGDGKGLDSQPYAQLAHHEAPSTDPEGLLEMLDELVEHMNAKYERLKALRVEKLSREISHGETLMMLDLLYIDELARYTKSGNPKISRNIVQRLRDISAVGPAAGVIPVLCTQRPSSTVVDPDVRDLIPVRWALRCPTWNTSDVILGAGAAKRGANAAELDEHHKGVAITSGATPVTFRADDTEYRDMERVAAHAYGLRKLAGVLPAGTTPRPCPPILEAMVSVFEQRQTDRLPTAEMVAALRTGDPSLWGGLDANGLAAAVRPFGLAPKNLGGLNVRGYLRARVDEAVQRAT